MTSELYKILQRKMLSLKTMHIITIICIQETFFQDFLEILKHSLQNYQKILKKCFLGPSQLITRNHNQCVFSSIFFCFSDSSVVSSSTTSITTTAHSNSSSITSATHRLPQFVPVPHHPPPPARIGWPLSRPDTQTPTSRSTLSTLSTRSDTQTPTRTTLTSRSDAQTASSSTTSVASTSRIKSSLLSPAKPSPVKQNTQTNISSLGQFKHTSQI